MTTKPYHHPACTDDNCEIRASMVAPFLRCWTGFQGEMTAERARAHAKHAASGGSAEQISWNDFGRWQAILFEEAGEVARAICEFELGNEDEEGTQVNLREELLQLASMAEAWAMSIDRVTNF